MSVQSTSPDAVNLFLGTPMDALSGTMSILMKTNKYYTNGSLFQTGTTQTVTQEWGKLAVEKGWASDVSSVIPQRQTPVTFSSAEQVALRASVSGARISVVQRCGSLATPLASVTLGGATGVFVLPVIPVIPAGLILPHSQVWVDARFRRTTAVASMTVTARLGTAGDTTDSIFGQATMSATANIDFRMFTSADFADSAAAFSTHQWGVINGGSAGAAVDRSANVNTAAAMSVSMGVSGTAGDTVALIGYSVWVQQAP